MGCTTALQGQARHGAWFSPTVREPFQQVFFFSVGCQPCLPLGGGPDGWGLGSRDARDAWEWMALPPVSLPWPRR